VPEKITIGSRGSKLAMTQSRWVADELRRFHPGLEVEIVEIKTSGDKNLGVSLTAFGGKGAFTKELEDAILAGSCDIAVHSLKDLPTSLPNGLAVLCTPMRAVTDDILILRDCKRPEGLLDELPEGATVGSSSLRRRAQLARLRPDLKVIEFRGNVDSRLRKLADGVADACILAAAGVRRLGLVENLERGLLVSGLRAEELEAPGWLPAAGQGALGIEGRIDDHRVAQLLKPLHHAATHVATMAERALLQALGAGCQAPVGVLATFRDASRLDIEAAIWSADGAKRVHAKVQFSAERPEEAGAALAKKLIAGGAKDLL
jgi:hydroxymethylbilane synthase